ncbi:MAG: hypothetical protein R2815_01385 [Flavobacteriales bacterium]
MRLRYLLFFALLLPFVTIAQPGPPEMDTCPFTGYDLYPIDPKRPDFRVAMFSEGTEDVPSSTGNCRMVVATLAHVDLLYAVDQRGNLVSDWPQQGYVLHPDSLAQGLARYRFRWLPGQLDIAYRGYGAAFTGMDWTAIDPRGYTQAIARVRTPEGNWLCFVRASSSPGQGFSEFHALATVREGEPLHWP